ncbi:MAG TPA: LuxR C-terminal-related transcriptional regulator [Candidatus Limnocylindrales bacterium]
MARTASRPGNLPAEATSFIGRRRELAGLKRKIAEARLVCLVGPGGVGKTRLALRAAADLARRFRDGARLVELAEVREPALVGGAVMAALDLRDQATTDPLSLALSHLRDKQLLLVVDNCEHLLDAAAGLVSEILKTSPGVRVIATSRETLTVAGEHIFPVPPLDLSSAHSAAPLARLRHNEAVMLFAERAVTGSGSFQLTAANQGAVADLCRRLDGLPLAIELAAVRTRVLSAQQILDRLTDRFGLLTGGGRTALPRHQTLRTTIDWSHDLLDESGQILLRRLSVFTGRFTLESVESVCSGDLDALSSLVDKSLVLKEEVNNTACYRLHETMREYAAIKLRAAGESETVESRCADHFRDRCRRSAVEARYHLVEWLDWMDIEIDTVRSVLQRCVATQDTRRGLELAAAMGWYWLTRATSEGVRWLDELLAHGSNPFALFLRGFLAVLQSDPVAGRPVLRRAVAGAREAGYAGLESLSLSMASVAELLAGDRIAGRRFLDEAQQVTEGLDDYVATIMLLQAHALNGLIESDRDLETVMLVAAEGIRLSRAVGDLYSLEMMLLNLGSAKLIGGNVDEPVPLLVEALRIARQIDDRVAQYCLLDALGFRAARCGQPRLAARLLGAAETVREGVGSWFSPHLGPLITEALQSAGTALGEAALRAELDAGKRMSREAAIALALGEPDDNVADSPASTPLGKRQAQVARLVADGLSNKQIAARLLISEHTVDSHIRGIMDKLGFSSRTQIAAWMATSEP